MSDEHKAREPLTKREVLAGFLATLRALDRGGGQAGFGRITREDKHGADYTFSLPNFMVRKLIAADPEALSEADVCLATKTPEDPS